jgi:hypothetical protein
VKSDVFEIYCDAGHPRQTVRKFVIVEARGRRFIWTTFGIDEHHRTIIDDRPVDDDEDGEVLGDAEKEGRARQWLRLVCKPCQRRPLEIRYEKLTPIILRLDSYRRPDGHRVSELSLSGLRGILQSQR